MTHVFISYTHADKIHLDKLVSWLYQNGFIEQDVWYDQHITGGNNWRDEITSALNEAFAVLVIVTANSVKSQYCTYEWAYAMGQGIPILPLTFDEVSIADVPTPLTSKQFITCTESIPDFLKDQIQRLRSTPPQVDVINRLVYEAVYDTHRRFFILGWAGHELRSSDIALGEEPIPYFVRKADKALRVLEALMTDKAFAFNSKQYRLCWKLIDFLSEFSELHHKVDTYFQERLFSQFDSSWLPAFEYFEGDKWWSRAIRPNFERNLSDEFAKLQVFAEIARVFPMLDGYEIDILLQNMTAIPDEHRGDT